MPAEPMRMVCITQTGAGTKTESDANHMRQGARTRGTPGGEVHTLIGIVSNPPTQHDMETGRNPLAISSSVKTLGAIVTDRSSTKTIQDTEEIGESRCDQGEVGTIKQPIADNDNKKAPNVETDVVPKTVKRVPIDRGRMVTHRHRRL